MAKVAFIMDNLFEDSEFRVPYDRVKEAGHEPVIIGLEKGKEIKGKKGKEEVVTDASIDEVSPKEFDALVIPGGYSPDLIRGNDRMVSFVRSIYEGEKPVAAICHAGWLLAEADIAKGKTLTSWPSIKTDLVNAGANLVDQEVVEDGNLITSRKP
ncbi:MAG TPA: type 1 glutamine amidotransferase domain-containing protein, partial [Actinomycetota bacterium]|nr:type 1 glutamine amidotransferase domain-containing protein [Actinomycetota bacterium]